MSGQGAYVTCVNATGSEVTFSFKNQTGMDTSAPPTVTVPANSQAASFYIAADLVAATSLQVYLNNVRATITELNWAWWFYTNDLGVLTGPGAGSTALVGAVQQNGKGYQDQIYLVCAVTT